MAFTFLRPPPEKQFPYYFALDETWARRLRWGCLLLYPLFAFFLVEFQRTRSFLPVTSLLYLVLNLGFYYLVAFALWVILGRAKLAGCITLSLFWLVGLINRYVYNFRGRGLVIGDLLSLRTAANVAGNYDYSPGPVQIVSGILCLGLLVLAFLIPPQKGREPIKPPAILGAVAGCLAFLLFFFPGSYLDRKNIQPSIWAPEQDGVILHFMLSLRAILPKAPAGYTPAAVREIRSSLPDDPETPDGIRPTNIIVVMNESFADLTAMDGVETNRDPIPFFHALTENTIKGTAYVSIFGGTTANSEYEFLTGHTTALLPSGSVPYQMFVKPGAASLVAQLNDLGYTTRAAHPFYASGWNRPYVYTQLGFRTIDFFDSYENVTFLRSYIDDYAAYRHILTSIANAAPGDKLFHFDVTMQNHGGYDQPWDNLPREVWLTGELEGLYPAADQYLNLVYQSDLALAQFIEQLSQVEAPTLLLFFGDHLPQLENEFYDQALSQLSEEEAFRQKYAVPFLLWANYDIPEQSGLELSLNYLSTLLIRTANLPMTDYQRFLSQLSQSVPIIHTAGLQDAQGNWYPQLTQLPQRVDQAVKQYRYIQYNELFDSSRNRLTDFFFLTTSGT